MTNKIVYLLIFILSFLSCKTDQKTERESLEKSKIENIDSLANRYLELNRFSGVILIAQDDTIIYNKSFGLADYENKKPFSNQTAFKIGAISELIVANIIEDMAESDRFKLFDQISQHLPELRTTVTINDLLTHNSSFPTIQTLKEQNPNTEYETIAYANFASQSSITSKKSDLNYNILGVLIEKISGMRFQENIANYSNSLRLENTYFQKEDSTLAVGYLYQNNQGRGLELQKAPVSNLEVRFSSNGLKSTASDLLKIINSDTSSALEIEGYLEDDGFSYSLVNNPKAKTTYIVLSNRRHPVGKEISNSIAEILEGKAFKLPLARKQFDIDKNILKDYSGMYSLNENMTIEVLNENDSLFVMMGPNKIHLIPQSANQFYMKHLDASMRFSRDTTNLVHDVELLDGFLNGNKIKRVKE